MNFRGVSKGGGGGGGQLTGNQRFVVAPMKQAEIHQYSPSKESNERIVVPVASK